MRMARALSGNSYESSSLQLFVQLISGLFHQGISFRTALSNSGFSPSWALSHRLMNNYFEQSLINLEAFGSSLCQQLGHKITKMMALILARISAREANHKYYQPSTLRYKADYRQVNKHKALCVPFEEFYTAGHPFPKLFLNVLNSVQHSTVHHKA